MKLERRNFLERDTKLGELGFAERKVSLIEKTLGDRQNSWNDFAVAGDVRKIRQRTEFAGRAACSRTKQLRIVTEPKQVFGIGSIGKGRVHVLEYRVESLRQLSTALRERVRRGSGHPTQTGGEFCSGTVYRPNLCPSVGRRNRLLFFSHDAEGLSFGNHVLLSSFREKLVFRCLLHHL